MSDAYFGSSNKLYQECSNPNDPEDKSLCLIVQDGSKFDGAVIRYTTFKLLEQELGGNEIACRYEYEIEVPPDDAEVEISDGDGIEFEKRLGEWVIEILQKQMEKHATKS